MTKNTDFLKTLTHGLLVFTCACAGEDQKKDENLFFGFGGKDNVGLIEGDPPELHPCPSRPNCVSSQASSDDQKHYMPPVLILGELGAVFGLVTTTLKSLHRTEIKEKDTKKGSKEGSNYYYLHAEYTTAFLRFVDDIELLLVELDTKTVRIHFRSASRVGYSDLGANRKRMQAFFESLSKNASHLKGTTSPLSPKPRP